MLFDFCCDDTYVRLVAIYFVGSLRKVPSAQYAAHK